MFAMETAVMAARLRLLAFAAALGSLAMLTPGLARAQEPIVLARSMLEVWAPQTNEVAGVLIDVLDAEGTPDPAKLTDEDWSQVLAVNLGSAFHLLHGATPLLRARGEGAVVLISSINGERGAPSPSISLTMSTCCGRRGTSDALP